MPNIILEPQAQVIAYKYKFKDAVDSKGYGMSQGDNSGVIARLGVNLALFDSNPTTLKPWFSANINKQNGSAPTGVMDTNSNIVLNSEKDSTWADMSVGMTYQISTEFSLYGHLKQSVAIGGGTNTTTSGAIGVQTTW